MAEDMPNEIDPLDITPEIGYTAHIKHECIASDLLSAFESESSDLATQSVKIEGRYPSCEEVCSLGQRQTNSPSSFVGLLPRIKTEDAEDSNLVDPFNIGTEIKREVPKQLLKYENGRDNRRDDVKVDVCSQVNSPLPTTSGKGKNKVDQILHQHNGEIPKDKSVAEWVTSPGQLQKNSPASFINLLTHIKAEGDEGGDELDDKLHTSCDIKNEGCGSAASFGIDIDNPAEFSSTVGTSRRKYHVYLVRNRSKTDDSLGQEISTGKILDQNSAIRRKNIERSLNPFICSFCFVSFANKVILSNHLKTHSGNKFFCRFNSASLAEENNSTALMRLFIGEKPFSCGRCSASFAHKHDLYLHDYRKHIGESRSFVCSHCSASFALKSYLKQHMQKHTGERPFRCDQCSASFGRKGNLKRHIPTHTDEKPFSCSHCSASYTQKKNLQNHMLTHTGKKPFSCCHCSASFAVKYDLNVHNICKHTSERPFICRHCSVSFTKKKYLPKHMLTHTGEKPFSCGHCSASFSQKYDLKVHNICKQTSERPFICSHCSVAFSLKRYLKQHIMQKH